MAVHAEEENVDGKDRKGAAGHEQGGKAAAATASEPHAIGHKDAEEETVEGKDSAGSAGPPEAKG